MAYKVSKIEDLEFYINDRIDFNSLKRDEISINVENSLNIYDNNASIITSIGYIKKNTRELILKEKLKLILEGEFHEYNLYSKSNKPQDKNKLIDLSVRLSIEINATIRGILYIKTKDLPTISQMYLPIIDESTLRMQLNEDI